MKRSIFGLIGAVLVFILFVFNVFGLEPEAIERWRVTGMIMLGLIVVASSINLIRCLSSGAMKSIDSYCAKTPRPEATKERLAQAWRQGMQFGVGRIDTAYVIMTDGLGAKIYSLDGLIWAYKYINKVNNISSVYVTLNYMDGKSKSISLGFNDSDGDRIVAYIMQNIPNVSVGHDSEREKLFKDKNWDGLRENAKTQRIAAGLNT